MLPFRRGAILLRGMGGASRDILFVEHDPGDQRLAARALAETGRVSLHVANDGREALDFLFRQGNFSGAPAPDLILLDLSLPNFHGSELLEIIKTSPDLMHIPVVALTAQPAAADRRGSCFVTKPTDLLSYLKLVQTIERYWLDVTRLPTALTA